MSELSILGLSTNEEKLYRELLILKKSSASELSKKSGVPHNRVYDYLESLIHKGFVRLIPGKIKEFVPAPPEEFELLIQAKKKELDKTQQLVTQLKEVYATNPKSSIEYVQGGENFWKIVRESPQAQKYDYSIKYNVDYHHEAIKRHNKNRTSKIERKTLARIDSETQNNVDKWKIIGNTILPIPNEGVAMSIIDDKFMFITLIHSGGTLIVRDEAFIKMMKLLYVNYYDKIKK